MACKDTWHWGSKTLLRDRWAWTVGNITLDFTTSGTAVQTYSGSTYSLIDSTATDSWALTLPAVSPPPAPVAPPPGFNRFVNASDVLAAFARFAEREARMNRQEFLDLPLRYFVQWLVLEAAAADGVESPPEVEPTVRLPRQPRCRACGRFLPRLFRSLGIEHCSPDHLQLTLQRRTLPALAAA